MDLGIKKEIENKSLEEFISKNIVKSKNFIQKKLSEFLIYLVVFFIPLLFLPETFLPLNLNKQFFIFSILTLTSLIWLVSFINVGKIRLRMNLPTLALFLLFLTSILSWFLNGKMHFGLFGIYGGEISAVFNTAILFLLFFILQTVFTERKIILNALILFLTSSFFSLVFWFSADNGFLSGFILPDSGFSTIGSENSFLLFLIFGFFISIGFIISSNRLLEKLVLVGSQIILVVSFFALGFNAGWYLITIGFLLFIFLYFSNKENFEMRKIQVSLFFIALIISIFFSFSNIADNPLELRLTYDASEDIIFSQYKNSYKEILIGSGPSTFHHSFLQYKNSIIPDLELNRIVFNSGYSALTDIFSDLGILGGLLFILFFFSILYSGARLLYLQASQNKYDTISISLFIVFFISFLELLFFSSNYVILITSIIFGALLVSYRYYILGEELKEIDLSSDRKKIFLGLIFSIFILALITFSYYKLTLRYMAEINYKKSLNVHNLEEKDDFYGFINKAIKLDDKNDAYFRSSADFSLTTLEGNMKNTNLSDKKEIEKISKDIQNIENLYSIAIKLNPNNFNNWSRLGFMYETISRFDSSVIQLAQDSYKKALILNPKNVDISFSLGKMYYESGKFEDAKRIFLEILSVFPDDSDVRFYLGYTYLKIGDKENALKIFELLKESDPKNNLLNQAIADIKKDIKNK
ncbi:MAG: tetratricopeptide repeat protein [Patescibacteria group bacterium]